MTRCCHPVLAYRLRQSDTAVNGRMPKSLVDQPTVRFQSVDFLRSRSEVASPSPMNHEVSFYFLVLLSLDRKRQVRTQLGPWGFGDSQSAIRFRLEETLFCRQRIDQGGVERFGQRSELPSVSSLNAAVAQQRLITEVPQYLTNCLQSHLRRLPCLPLSSIL